MMRALLSPAAILVAAALALATTSTDSSAFYVPGVAPRSFKQGEPVELKVVKLTSVRAQLPYAYYSLPVCKPSKVEDAAENLGEVLSGDVIENSPFDIRMMVSQNCRELCTTKYGYAERALFREKISNKYMVQWLVDNLPAAMRVQYGSPEGAAADAGDESAAGGGASGEYFEVGFPLGAEVPSASDANQKLFYLYNHVRLKLSVHSNPDVFEGYRVVRFEVEPFTVKHKKDAAGKITTCGQNGRVTADAPPQPIGSSDEKPDDKRVEEVVWTYDVEWVESDVPWASRWDVFFNRAPEDTIHWFSIVNSLMIVVFLSGMVAMILMRTLHKDIARYNAAAGAAAGGDLNAAGLVLVDPEDAQEETGWKLVHGDVFRPPAFPMLLSVAIGTGVQIFACTLILMMFAVLGVLSPANRGGLMTAMLLLFVCCASFAGYWSARLYKMFGGKLWRRNTLLTALMYPGFVFADFFFVNLFVWSAGSSGAVPFLTMFALLVLWFGISVPLAFLGSYFGFKQEEIKNPCRTNVIPRAIPQQAWFMHPVFGILVGGVLPFGSVFIEAFFIMTSVWGHTIYSVFGFGLIVLLILIVTCAEITIVLAYFQLCAEDYHWWWRSFLTSGSSALYLFLYSVFYYVQKLNFTRYEAGIQYFMYMAAVSVTFMLLTGMIGFASCFMFVRLIFGSIKVE